MDKSLKGKVVLVTGGTAGIGLEIYRQLAARGAKRVYLSGRNEVAGRRAAAEFPNVGVYVKMDLSTIATAHAAAEAFLALESERLDILVNNAAMLSATYGLNVDGIVNVMGTNHFGTFVLTNALLPLMIKTASQPGGDVRIVLVGSDAYKYQTDIRFNSIDAMNALEADNITTRVLRYGTSKLAQQLYVKELHNRLGATNPNIHLFVSNPGMTKSDGLYDDINGLPLPLRLVGRGILGLLGTSPASAAYTTIFAATVSDPAPYRNKFLCRSRLTGSLFVEPWSGLMLNDDSSKELWETTERVVAEKLTEHQ